MTGAEVGLGFLGTGRWSWALAAAARRAGGLRLVGCYDPLEEAAVRWCKRFGGRVFRSAEELVSDRQVEGVVVVTPNHLHVGMAELALAAGKPVFVEKPLCRSVAEGKRLEELVRRTGLPLAVGHCARRLRGIRSLRALVNSGELGDVVLFEGNYSNGRAWELSGDSWRADPDYGRGGPGCSWARTSWTPYGTWAGPWGGSRHWPDVNFLPLPWRTPLWY